MKDTAPYVRDLSWRYPQRIEPLPLPYPWRRMTWATIWTLVLIGLSALVLWV